MAVRRVLFPAILAVFVLALIGAPATARSPRAKPKPTTTRQATTTSSTTTTVGPTTTTIGPTTTGAMPTTTINMGGTEPPAEGPIVISSGGTYSNRTFVSTDSAVPAIRISTTSPVTLDHVVARHKGRAIDDGVSGAQLTVTNSKFIALDPGSPVDQRTVDLDNPGSTFVFEHNLITGGMGIWLGTSVTMTTVRIRYNDAVNTARYGDPSCCKQFVQFDHVTAPADISWNRTFNTQGLSQVEDNINMFGASGVDAANPILIHHNMIRGAYARTGDGSGYTGGGILVGDQGGNFLTVADNRVIGTSNYGVSITGGHDNYLLRNRVVNDGKTEAGAAHGPSTATGVVVWEASASFPTGANTSAQDNVIGWTKPDTTRNDTWLPECDPPGACTGNSAMTGPITAQMELDEWNAWAVDLAAAGLTVGPNW